MGSEDARCCWSHRTLGGQRVEQSVHGFRRGRPPWCDSGRGPALCSAGSHTAPRPAGSRPVGSAAPAIHSVHSTRRRQAARKAASWSTTSIIPATPLTVSTSRTGHVREFWREVRRLDGSTVVRVPLVFGSGFYRGASAPRGARTRLLQGNSVGQELFILAPVRKLAGLLTEVLLVAVP